jgi:hypothetical protein
MIEAVIILLVIFIIILVLKASEHMEQKLGYIYDTNIPGPCIGFLASVHGNEPAGGLLLTKMINDGWFPRNLKRGSVRVISNPNPTGLRLGIRNRPFSGDLNRTFYPGTADKDAIAIIKFFEPCKIVVDFHEGWGFHLINSESLGSTVMANSEYSEALAREIVADLNNSALMTKQTYADPRKKFVVMPKEQTCDIKTTFACYRAGLGEHHILVETTGQNNIQPLLIRQTQVLTIIQKIIKDV